MEKLKALFLRILPFIIIILFIFFITSPLIAKQGIITGEDTAYPNTKLQIIKIIEISSNSWDFNSLISSRSFNAGAATPFYLFELFLVNFGMTPATFTKIFLYISYLFPATAIYIFLRYLKYSKISATISSIILITTPVFFNYTIMGWYYVLLSIGFMLFALVLYFKSVNEKNKLYIPFIAILYSLAFAQSQSIIWFPILVMCSYPYLVHKKDDFVLCSSNILLIFIIFLLINSYTIFPQILAPNKAITGSDYLYAPASQGMLVNFYPLNIIRGWGSLYNMQYEGILTREGIPLVSFIVPTLAVVGIFFSKNKRHTVMFIIIYLIPFIFSCMIPYRKFLYAVPLANVIRDFARFSIFSAIGSSMLIASVIDHYVNKKGI